MKVFILSLSCTIPSVMMMIFSEHSLDKSNNVCILTADTVSLYTAQGEREMHNLINCSIQYLKGLPGPGNTDLIPPC